MSTVHKMERALVGKGIDGVLHYVNKDPEDRKKALLNLDRLLGCRVRA